MADTKISDLTSITQADLASGDLFPVVDVSATTLGSKSITVSELDSRYISTKVMNSWTPTVNTGTYSTQTGFWWEAGPVRFYRVNLITSAAGSAADIEISLPSGHVMDTTFLGYSAGDDQLNDVLGTGDWWNNGSSHVPLSVIYYTTTTVTLTYGTASFNPLQGSVLASGDRLGFVFSAPISGLTEAP